MLLRGISKSSELQAILPCWEDWQINPNSDFDLFNLLCGLRPEVLQPYVVSAEKAGSPCALLLCRLESTNFAPRIGYFSPLRIPANVLVVLHEGLIGEADIKTAELMVRHLRSLLSMRFADAVVFHSVSENSTLFRALQDYAPRSWSTRNPTWSVHRAMQLMADTGFLLKRLRSKHRSWIRKKMRDLEGAFPGTVSWSWIDRFDDIPGICAKLEAVAARTYQRGLEAGFVDDEEHRRLLDLFAGKGQLRIQLLEIEGKVAAFWIGVLYRGVFYTGDTGYDPDLSEYRVGTLVFLHMVDELVKEGVRKLDFGLGDAQYKQRFGDESWRETSITMFAPTAKGLLLKSVLLGCSVLDLAGRRLLERSGLLDRIKTGWRQRLSRAGKQMSGKMDGADSTSTASKSDTDEDSL